MRDIARVIPQGQAETVSYILGDHLGSTSLTVNTGGIMTGKLRYKAFAPCAALQGCCASETRYTWGTTPTQRRYTGQINDAEIGLYFYNSRFYDPTLGRFIQPDSIIPEGQGTQAWDRFAYVNNSPIRFVDPGGHDPKCGSTCNPDPVTSVLLLFWTQLIQIGYFEGVDISFDHFYAAWEYGSSVANAAFENGDPIDYNYNVGFNMSMVLGMTEGDAMFFATFFFKPAMETEVFRGALMVQAAQDAARITAGIVGMMSMANQTNIASAHSRRNFRENLKNLTNVNGEEVAGADAHHNFPVKFSRIFKQKYGINTNDPRNGSWVSSGWHRSFSRYLNNQWEDYLKTNPSISQVYDYARHWAREFGYDTNFDR